MLITAEALAKQLTKASPVEALNAALNRLEPTFGLASELHRGATYLDRWIYKIHLKVCLGLGDPKLQIVPLKLREMHFG
jgi:hypothetical protein